MIALVAAAAWALPGNCSPDGTFDCSSDISSQLLAADPDDVSGNFSCGVPNGASAQPGPDHVYEFTCPVTGDLVIDWGGLDCDLDIYIIDDTCDPDGLGCIAGANDAGTTPARLQFACIQGNTYYIVVEAWGYTVGVGVQGACNPNGQFGFYTVRADAAASTACAELCDDGLDNDSNNLWDCDDPSCAADVACIGVEICNNGIDDDSDGDIDCDDDDCEDHDLDGVPDGCDQCPGSDDALDADGDAAPDDCDRCPGFDDRLDTDSDGVPEDCDNCPDDANPGQSDSDVDTVGDPCDQCPGADDLFDSDADLLADACDNCPSDPNEDQTDTDGDSVGDLCDVCEGYNDARDADGDGVPEDCDNCPGLANVTQVDDDQDGIGDNCDDCIAVDEVCDNGTDDDCDGEIDEGCTTDTTTATGDDDDLSAKVGRESEESGCSCSQASGSAGLLPIFLLLALRRR